MGPIRQPCSRVSRNLNRRDSAPRSSLVSVELTSDETLATGDRLRFVRSGHTFALDENAADAKL